MVGTRNVRMEKAYKDNKIVEEMGHVTEISLNEKIKESKGRKCVIPRKEKKKKSTVENNIRKKRQDKREK